MEALLFIFAEILFACLAPLLALVGAILGVILEAIAMLLGGVFGQWAGERRAKRKAAAGKPPPKQPVRSWKALHWSAGLLGGLGVAGILAATFFFEPILGSILNRASAKAGIEISFEEAKGSFFTGRVEMSGVTVARESEAGLAFDMSIARIEADVEVMSLIGAEPVLTLARVSGVSGVVTPPLMIEKPKKERRPFRADLVQVSNVEIEVRPREGDAYDVEIEAGEVAPFRSRLALFDLLFRSNLEARIAGQDLTVKTERISENGRETLWDFDRVEADRLKLMVPKAPLIWLEGGTVSARVQDRWSLTDDEIDMDWAITLDGISVAAPEDAGRAERFMAGGLARAVAAQGGDAAFRYRLDLTKPQVQAMRAGDLSAFWDVVLSGVVSPEIVETEEEGGGLKGAFGKLKGFLKRDEGE